MSFIVADVSWVLQSFDEYSKRSDEKCEILCSPEIYFEEQVSALNNI